VTAPNAIKGYDERGRFSPLLAMQALSGAYDELLAENIELHKRVEVLRFMLSRERVKHEV